MCATHVQNLWIVDVEARMTVGKGAHEKPASGIRYIWLKIAAQENEKTPSRLGAPSAPGPRRFPAPAVAKHAAQT